MPFSLEERERRYDLVRQSMRDQGLDALVVFGSTGTGIPFNGNYPYLANHTLIYSSALLFFPLQGEPAAFIPGENQLLDARRTLWIDDARLSRQPAHDLCGRVKSALGGSARIGVSSFAAMPASGLQVLRDALPDAEMVDAGATILAARERKSDEEIAAARRGADVADLAFEKSLEIIRPGLDERQWRAAVESVMTASGADGGFNMLSVGQADDNHDPFRGFVVPPSQRTFRKGDLALLEISPRVAGYFSQMVRLVSLGAPPQAIRDAHAACIRAKQLALSKLTAGASFVEVVAAIDGGLTGAGFTMKDVAGAHTIGLDLSEAVFTRSNPGVVADRMLVTVHPMIDLGEWRQLFVGETYLVDGGVESLSRYADEIFVLA